MKRELQIKAWQARRAVAVMFLLAVFSLAACSDVDIDNKKLNEKSNFSVANQVANEYLVVTVVVTENNIRPVGSHLARGPTKANSAFPDLEIRTYAGAKLVMDYTMQDPRFIHRDEEWVVLLSAEIMVFVPLLSTVDNVVIRPVAGREHMVSRGGEFHPLHWAIIACRKEGGDFAACAAILADAPVRLNVPQ